MMISVPQEDEVQTAAQEAFRRNPVLSSWGFCAYGDGPGGMGDGVPAFYWFDGQQAMFQYIAKYMTWVNPVPENDNQEAVAVEVQRICEDAAEQSLESVQKKLNNALTGFSQFEWLGRFADLATGQTEFAREIRQRYYEQVSELEDCSQELDLTIPETLHEFVRICREYCIPIFNPKCNREVLSRRALLGSGSKNSLPESDAL